MIIWPAIDICGGKCVRLKQGDYNRETVYGDPVEMAGHWIGLGAERLHLVDLDGARDGKAKNFDSIRKILEQWNIPCQLGGGIRDESTISRYLEIGVRQLVVGTLALKNPEWFEEMSKKYPQRLVLGIDAKNGMVATDGWLETSRTSGIELARRFEKLPIAAIVYTDIATDGMMQGPNVAEMKAISQAVAVPITASGGVSKIEDIIALSEAGLPGCIIGRALYEGTIDLKEALRH